MSGAEKNCHTCKHLEWVDGEDEASTGFDCNKRHLSNMEPKSEAVLLALLNSDAYRNRYKRCYEPKE